VITILNKYNLLKFPETKKDRGEAALFPETKKDRGEAAFLLYSLFVS